MISLIIYMPFSYKMFSGKERLVERQGQKGRRGQQGTLLSSTLFNTSSYTMLVVIRRSTADAIAFAAQYGATVSNECWTDEEIAAKMAIYNAPP
jgi:hypothetical protein